ncbi:MAG: purine-nucleoside phosphorylase [Gemmataceae bacterium]
MSTLSFDQFQQYVHEHKPIVTLILGSGMGEVVSRIKTISSIRYTEIPTLPATSVEGHRGELLLGRWEERVVLVFQGRLHRYEGHDWKTVVEPVRLAHTFGVRYLLATNAAGGIHDSFGPGSLVAITNHMIWADPGFFSKLASETHFPNPSPYSFEILDLLRKAAEETSVELHQGTYAAVTGPSYETRSEILAMKAIGADVVGMSTAKEVEMGCSLGLECGAVSCVTNRAAGLSHGPINHGEVLFTAAAQTQRLAVLLEAVLRGLEG